MKTKTIILLIAAVSVFCSVQGAYHSHMSPARMHIIHRTTRPRPRPPVHHAPKPVVHPKPVHHDVYHPYWRPSIMPFVLTSAVLHRSHLPPPPPPTLVGPVAQQYVWIEGHYELQLQPNGATISVWVPGRYVLQPIQ